MRVFRPGPVRALTTETTQPDESSIGVSANLSTAST
jgi:hypothetical protein